MYKITFCFQEIQPPNDLVCDMGHASDPEFQGKPIRFWKVQGQGIQKIICDPCMILVNFLVQVKK